MPQVPDKILYAIMTYGFAYPVIIMFLAFFLYLIGSCLLMLLDCSGD